MRASPLLSILLTLGLLLVSLPALSQNSVRSGELIVHYNALPTTRLTPDVARQSGVTRSANRALVNVAVRRGSPGADQAVVAAVTLSATNLNGQRQTLRVREVREGDAIYYLAEARYSGNETLDFELQVTVEGAPPISAQFRQEFFAE